MDWRVEAAAVEVKSGRKRHYDFERGVVNPPPMYHEAWDASITNFAGN